MVAFRRKDCRIEYRKNHRKRIDSRLALGARSVIEVSHSALAMNAARRMGSSAQKQKTGRVVCHHLRMMLAESGKVSGPVYYPDTDSRQISLGF